METSASFEARSAPSPYPTSKASLYARAAITDYWIVNLVDRVVELRRGPMTSDAAPFGWTYERLTISGPGEMVTPLAAPFASIAVADLLP